MNTPSKIFSILIIATANLFSHNVLSQNIKSITTRSYSINDFNDTSYVKKSCEYFNKLGLQDSLIEFNEGGKLTIRIVNSYNDKGNLIESAKNDYSGRGSLEIQKYHYNNMDSLIKHTINENGFILTIDIQRNDSNLIQVKRLSNSRDGLIETDSLFYNHNHQIVLFKSYNGLNNLLYQSKRLYNLENELIEESVLRQLPIDTTLTKNQYYYNTSGKIDSIRQYWNNFNNYSLIKYSYYENGIISKCITECIGCELGTTSIKEFDIKGNLTAHKKYRSNVDIFDLTYAFTYDNNGNWILKRYTSKTTSKIGWVRDIKYY